MSAAGRPTAGPVAGGSPARRAVLVEADGGSRGNPGPAAYGAVLKDATTGEVLAEDGTTIGRATNNVAEYRGLIGGLRLAADLAPDAELEVRMDSKLVVEQMAGRWKVKHAGLVPLVEEARALAPAGTTWTWVPRARNAHADRLANEALDGARDGVTVAATTTSTPSTSTPAAPAAPAAPAPAPAPTPAPAQGWRGHTVQQPTTLVLVRHGVTPMTAEKRFSGGLGGSNPGLTDEGRDQVRAAADWLAPLAERVDVVLASPVRRTRESGDIVAEVLAVPLREEPAFAEMEFGAWDGLTFGEVRERHGAELEAWLGSTDVSAGGGTGESMQGVHDRVLAGLDRVLAEHAGGTVVVLSHVTPIKVLLAHALGAPLEALFRMELAPASVSVTAWWPHEVPEHGHRGSMRLFNAVPPAAGGPAGW